MFSDKQYTGKSEATFNLRLNNLRKDVYKQNSLQADRHFRLLRHNFNKNAKFTLIEQLNDTNLNKELLKYRLKKRVDFWIKKFTALQTHGFNAELNFPNPNNFAFFVHLFL